MKKPLAPHRKFIIEVVGEKSKSTNMETNYIVS